MVRGVILPAARPGIAAAIILGLGRALGEAIAVTQVIGAGPAASTRRCSRPATRSPAGSRASSRAPARSCRSSSLFYLAAILLVIGLADELARAADRAPLRVPAGGSRADGRRRAALSLRGDARVRRRRIVNRIAESSATIAALLALGVLGIVVVSVAKRGAGELSWDFLTEDLPTFGQTGGGIAPLIVGSAILVGIATAIALPLGVLMALFLSEFAPRRVAAAIQLTIDLMNGLPSIIIGIFVFGLLVYGHTAERLRGRLRAVDRDAAADRALDAGGAAARAVRAARSAPRARRQPLADRRRRSSCRARSAGS